MKRFSFYIVIFFFVLPLLSSGVVIKDNPDDLNKDISNFIAIKGSSNINHFTFINKNIDYIRINQPDDRSKALQRIIIPAYKFSASNHRMLNDFYEMIDAEDHPNILIDINTAQLQHPGDNSSDSTYISAKISIAGTSHNYLIPCIFSKNFRSESMLTGKMEIALTDFNITPPIKAFGAIKVKNRVFINFAFELNTIDEHSGEARVIN